MMDRDEGHTFETGAAQPSEPTNDERANERDFVNALARGLEVIRAFSRHKPRMTLTEVATATGMTRATARRLLLTLEREGYAQSDGKHFSLRPKVLELGLSALSSMDFWEIAQPIMNDLSERISESVFAAVLEDDEVVYVARAHAASRRISIGIHIGSRAPAHCVSTGRVLLAAQPDEALDRYLDNATLEAVTPYTETSPVRLRERIEDARRQGWSLVDQELEVGLRSLSVPIRNRFGDTVAALNVCCPTPRWTLDDMRSKLLVDLLDASNRITVGLQR
ncbi:MAG: IclR family transcriptional regulator C-terminal domain-containing protein [Roseitalea porphyridii]|uniref:IclR family transcriptional regulator domain-containing protein n=1 Tax=Roseitalea porphyridii TaxID=1852022 RepID=UPI0032D93C49